jgi:hypothetical protein
MICTSALNMLFNFVLMLRKAFNTIRLSILRWQFLKEERKKYGFFEAKRIEFIVKNRI